MDNTTLSPRACARVTTRGVGRKPGASSHRRNRLAISARNYRMEGPASGPPVSAPICSTNTFLFLLPALTSARIYSGDSANWSVPAKP